MRVSVVIPLYNKVGLVGQTIGSVLAQTSQEFEIVVVDDGSTDQSAAVVRSFDDPRIRLLEQRNAGAAAARNAGIKASRGEWIAFLDADDLWLPDHLAQHMALLDRHPQLQWSSGFFERRSKSGTPRVALDLGFLSRQMEGEVVRDALSLLPRGFLWTGAMVVRKSVFAEVGYLDPALRTAEDLDMWLRIALRHPRMAYCIKPTALYSVDVDNSLTRQRVSNPTALPHFLFARKHLPDLSALPPDGSEAARSLARGLVAIGIKRLLLSGHPVVALQVVDEFRDLLGASACSRFRLLALAPALLLRAGFAAKQLLKRYGTVTVQPFPGNMP